MNKIKMVFDYDGYEFHLMGVMSDNGHVEGFRLSPLGFEIEELDKDIIADIELAAQERLIEAFYSPEMEFDV